MPEREKNELRILARRKGFTILSLAKHMKFSRITVWRHATGERSPSVEERIAYAEALGQSKVDLDGLFNRAMDAFAKKALARRANHDAEKLTIAEDPISVSPTAGRIGPPRTRRKAAKDKRGHK